MPPCLPPVLRSAPLTLVLAAAACGGSSGSGTDPLPNDDFDRRRLLSSYTEQVVLPAVRNFASAAAELASTTAILESALISADTAPEEHAAARDAFLEAMAAWQAIEVLQVGPAGNPGMAMGGQGLRDEIYSWPVVNPCRVDQETVRGQFLAPDFFSTALVNLRGLDAIEYLLFAPDEANACSPSVDINTSGSWSSLVATGDLGPRRAAYAARASADVADLAANLRDLWEPTGGNFAAQLTGAGTDTSIFPSAQSATDDVFAALFYIELDTKDLKIATPAGLLPDCPRSVCPDLVESPWADASKDHILANLTAARRTFVGGSSTATGVGFDDFLVARGADSLAATMLSALETAIDAVEAIPGSMVEALESDPESVRTAHAAIKAFTDPLKTQFVTVLNLTIPQEGAGDND